MDTIGITQKPKADPTGTRALRKTIVVVLLSGGVLAPLMYFFMNAIAAMRFPGYSSVDQTVSELSAIGAPSRTLWIRLGIAYAGFLVAFGIGVWKVARGRRALRIVGAAIVVDAVIGLAWPPMHPRGAGTSLTDTLHIVWTAITLPLIVVAIAFAIKAFGKRFRVYSLLTLAVMVVFGALTGVLYGPDIPKNLPTPFCGVVERVGIAAFMAWFAVLAVMLIREARAKSKSVSNDQLRYAA